LTILRIGMQTATGLAAAHRQGLVHRDVKPANILLEDGAQRITLTDFGLARAADDASLTRSGVVAGTPMYMAPEQARGEKVDVRSDVYSLGLTLYELLTDAKPFESESVYETLRKVQETDPQSIRQLDRKLSEDLDTIVMKAIAKDASSRYASAQEFADDLEAYLKGDAIRGKRESLHRKLIRRVRRHPFAFATGAVLLAGLATSGLILTRASRDRTVIEITTKVEQALRSPEWSDAQVRSVETLIAELSPAAPEQARVLTVRLQNALATSIRAADLARARAELPLLERLDPAEAARVAAELRQREKIWPPVFKMEPPFADLAGVFEPGKVRVEGDLLRAAAPGVVRTRKGCEGNVEMKGEFDGPWREASQIGLLLHPGDPAGYQFLMITVEGPTPPSFAAMREARGAFRLQIRRGDTVLREELVKSESIGLAQPLRLVAKRDGDLLTLQVNDLPQVGFRDPFALAARQRGVFGVLWPEGVAVRRLLASHQVLPTNPSLLDVADSLFLQRRFEEALDRYGEAAQSAGGGEGRAQALYKQGLCAMFLNRGEDARKIFEGVAAGFLTSQKDEEKYWYFLADCQLLVLYFREKDGIERATSILDKLPEYRFSFDKLAVLMPPDVQRQILSNVQSTSLGGNLHLRPEEHVARTEFSLRASELLEPPAQRGEWKYHGLMRAYMGVGRHVEALRTAEKSFRIYRFGGEVLDDYCWVLRLSGTPADLQKAMASIDRGLANDPVHRVERARIRAALKDWKGALEDLDVLLQKPVDYQSHSASCLLRGFVLEQLGEPADKVAEAWRAGLLKNWKAGGKGIDTYDTSRAPSGMAMLHNWIMASMTGELSDADAEQLLAGLLTFAGKDNPVFNKLMRPSVLRATWRTPRAREVARHVATRDLPFSDIARYPLFVGWIEFIHEVCFNASAPLSPDQDELLWQMSDAIYTAYRAGALTDRYFLPFGAIVSGNPHAPGMGWREVAILLEKNPKLRGSLAYVFGHRYLKKADPKTALMFFKSAAADAVREPAQPLLQRLSQAELDALQK
jgi:tetratricopeptide (TPR) repeat protein